MIRSGCTQHTHVGSGDSLGTPRVLAPAPTRPEEKEDQGGDSQELT